MLRVASIQRDELSDEAADEGHAAANDIERDGANVDHSLERRLRVTRDELEGARWVVERALDARPPAFRVFRDTTGARIGA